MEQRPQFDSKYLVGIEQVDREHRKLIEIAGKVYDNLAHDDAATIEATRNAVRELIDYTVTHFASEEALMAAAGYPDLAAHRELHRHLLKQVHDMEMRVAFGERYVPIELSHFLYNWLTKHIQADDRKFGEFMAVRR